MTKHDTQKDQVKHISGGAHLGGTRFGQQPGDAKLKNEHSGPQTKEQADSKDDNPRQ